MATVKLKSAKPKAEIKKSLKQPVENPALKKDLPDLTAALQKHFGLDSFRGTQEDVITNLLSGNDTFVIMPTGGGKSLCYQLPAIISDGVAIIVSPLIALMKNQVDQLRAFGGSDSIAHFLNSSLTKSDIGRVKDDVLAGKTKLLYVAPESLTKQENIDFLRLNQVSFVAVDEAHCISEWGHDFRPAYLRLGVNAREFCQAAADTVPIIALTGTASFDVLDDGSNRSRYSLAQPSLL